MISKLCVAKMCYTPPIVYFVSLHSNSEIAEIVDSRWQLDKQKLTVTACSQSYKYIDTVCISVINKEKSKNTNRFNGK